MAGRAGAAFSSRGGMGRAGLCASSCSVWCGSGDRTGQVIGGRDLATAVESTGSGLAGCVLKWCVRWVGTIARGEKGTGIVHGAYAQRLPAAGTAVLPLDAA